MESKFTLDLENDVDIGVNIAVGDFLLAFHFNKVRLKRAFQYRTLRATLRAYHPIFHVSTLQKQNVHLESSSVPKERKIKPIIFKIKKPTSMMMYQNQCHVITIIIIFPNENIYSSN